MKIEDYVEEFKKRGMEDEDKLLLYVLGSSPIPFNSKTSIQQFVYKVSEKDEDIKELLDYEEYLIGQYSEVVDNALDELIVLALVRKKGRHYELTDVGKEIFKWLNPKPSVVKAVKEAMEEVEK